NPPAILKAYQVARKQGEITGDVKIVGFDEYDATLKGIRDGEIVGTVAQQGFEFGYQSVKLMAQIAKGDRSGIPQSGVMWINHKRVTRDNVDEFHSHLKKLMGK